MLGLDEKYTSYGAEEKTDRRKSGQLIEAIFRYQEIRAKRRALKKELSDLEGIEAATEAELVAMAKALYAEDETYQILAELIVRASAPAVRPTP